MGVKKFKRQNTSFGVGGEETLLPSDKGEIILLASAIAKLAKGDQTFPKLF